jgi:hypothetical protein
VLRPFEQEDQFSLGQEGPGEYQPRSPRLIRISVTRLRRNPRASSSGLRRLRGGIIEGDHIRFGTLDGVCRVGLAAGDSLSGFPGARAVRVGFGAGLSCFVGSGAATAIVKIVPAFSA